MDALADWHENVPALSGPAIIRTSGRPLTLIAGIIRPPGPADAAVVAAYGLILPGRMLQAPRLGCLNVHASLLPRWRGAAPIQRALLAGQRRQRGQAAEGGQGADKPA